MVGVVQVDFLPRPFQKLSGQYQALISYSVQKTSFHILFEHRLVIFVALIVCLFVRFATKLTRFIFHFTKVFVT